MSDISQPNRVVDSGRQTGAHALQPERPFDDGIAYDPIQGIPASPRPSLAMPGAVPSVAPQQRIETTAPPGAQAYAARVPQPGAALPYQAPVEAPEPVAPMEAARFMEASDIYGIPELIPSVPVAQTFVLNGVPMLMEISTDAMTDAEKFYELTTVMQGKRNPDGTPAPQTMVVQPPNGERFTLSNPVYIGGLNLLSATVAQPKMSPEEWAMLGKRIGAKGRQKGWHGIEDIADVAAKANGMGQKAVSEDEQGAGKGALPPASNTV